MRIFLIALSSLVMQGAMLPSGQQSPSAHLVELNGLKNAYVSCAPVRFSVKNISNKELYIEVYAENLESNSWTDADYPYDIKDPESLYMKRILINPDMMKPGTSIELTYDRCLKPRFVKETKKAFSNAIIEKDAKSGFSILQRLRADVYVLENGHVKPVQKLTSDSFRRLAG
jgi:hypothetical protein